MIVGLTSPQKGSGKDCVARMITSCHYVKGLNENRSQLENIRPVVPTDVPEALWSFDSRAVQLSFADPIKVIAHTLYGWDVATLWGPSVLRETPDPRYPRGDGTFLTPRLFLQIEGTEVARACYPGTWVDKTMQFADALIQERDVVNIAIADIRFDSEVPNIVARDGLILEVVNPRLPPSTDKHKSEAGISRHLIAATVVNDGTFEALHERVCEALKRAG